jgi:DNA-binding CsgD family transcriptional regulator
MVGSHQSPPAAGSLPLVGRQAERLVLREQLNAAIAGRGRLVILGGEAGIGKTALCRDLAATAATLGVIALIGFCYDLAATPPYGPWLDLAARYRPGDPLPPLPEVLASGRIDEIASQAGFFALVRNFLGALAPAGPILLVLEDLHWSDPASVDLLRHLGPRLAGLPILMVVTYRVDEVTRRHLLYRQLPALLRESDGVRLDLDRLAPDELRVLVERHWPLAQADEDRLVAYLDRHADGNPFVALEMGRSLADDGMLRPGPNQTGWELDELPGIVVPDLLRQVIDIRIGRLGDEIRDALTLAAVIGQEVPLDLWGQVGGLSHDALLDVVERAVDAHLLDAARDGTRVRFVHALTREALYEGMLPPRRRIWHGRVAEALMRQALPDPDAVAYHLQQAGDPRAGEWLARAGERAQRAYAWLTAAERSAAAADLLGEVPGQEVTRARLLVRAGRLLRYAHPARGLTALAEAQRLARATGDRPLTADATYSLGLLRCYADDFARGLPEMEEGILALEALPLQEARPSWASESWLVDAVSAYDDTAPPNIDPAFESLAAQGIHHRRGGLPWFMAAAGRLTEAEAIGKRFIAAVTGLAAGPTTRSAVGHAYHGLGIAYAALGRPEEARAALATARAHYRELDHHAAIAFTLLTELRDVMIVYYTTDLAERARVAAAAEEALERAGGALLAGVSPSWARLSLLLLEGRWDELLALTSGTPTPGNYYLQRELATTLLYVAHRRGDPDPALARIHVVLPHGPATPPGSAVLVDSLILLRVAAELAIERDDLTGARAWLEAHDRWLAWSGCVIGAVEGQATWASYYHAAGDLARARAAADAAVRLAEAPPRPFACLKALRRRGRVARAAGDSAGADRDLAAALDLAVACAAPYERAQTLLEIAELRLTTASPESAAGALAEARSILEPLAAAPALDRLADLAGRGPSAAVPAGLTRRELDVLRLVADGLTDVAIAERLFISPRTVGQHLRSVYAKLGVSSRAAATRFAVEHSLT